MDAMGEDLGKPSEKLRKMLIEQELRMRKKQPEHWAKTKYRKYAKPYTELELVKIKELEKKRKRRGKAARKARRRKTKARAKTNAWRRKSKT